MVGTAAVVATGVVKIRRDDAKFIKVYSEGESVVMIVEVNKWSKDLRIRVTDGDKIDYVYIEPRYDEEYPDREYYDNYYSERESDGEYYYYYAENAGEGRKIVVELVGDKVFLNDVLDRAEVEVKGYDYYSDPNEEYSGGESSDDSGNDATYGDESSDDSGNDATYGGESSDESGNDATYGDESSDDSGNDATYGDESSNESGNDTTYGGESSNESGGTNGTSDDGSYVQSDGNVGEYDPTQG